MKRFVAFAVGIAWSTASFAARAETACLVTGSPVVELVLELLPPDEIIGITLERHLRSELRERDIDLCTTRPTKAPLARVKLHVEHPAAGPVMATISIDDEVTHKHVERVIDLTKLPPETRPLIVAASTDELLRASWVELQLADAPPPAMPPPPEVIAAVTSTLSPIAAPPNHFEVGVLAEVSSFFGERTGVGGGLVGAWWFVPRAALRARFSATYGLSESTTNGRVRADTTSAGLGGMFALVPTERVVGARLEAGVQAARVAFEGIANPGTTALRGADWTAIASLGAEGWVAVTRELRLTLGASALYALRPVRALDEQSRVMAIEGFGAEATLGALATF